jgi:antitoxin component YwqK of YwqJK toxin-antitoxin module
MANQIKKEDNFCNLLDHQGINNIRHVPNYENSFVFYYKKFEDNKFKLVSTTLRIRSPSRSPSISIGFRKNGSIGYEEFFLEHVLQVCYTESQKLSKISFEDDMGNREIKFDENEKVVSDDFKQFPQKEIQERLDIRKQMDAEISDSIAAGYTEVQKIQPKKWSLRLPKEIKDEVVRERLTKIGEYHQAIIAGKAEPLVDNQVFAKHVKKEIRPSVHIFYSGKKVSFLGAYAIDDWCDPGYFMVFDEYARLVKYVEGEITFDQNLTGYDVAKSAKLFLEDMFSETNRRPSGLEITFHPSGYPASYKTIVKNRLFGRQIEWDEMGNVLSDIDQDIPILLPDTSLPTNNSLQQGK